MKYKHVERFRKDQAIAQLFGYDIDVPDEYGKVLSSHKIGHFINCICEHGTYIHRTKPRDPVEMKYKGLRARDIHSSRLP